jgi:predicted nucleic acid-binding protein
LTEERRAPAVQVRAVLDTSVLLSEHRHWLWLLARLGYYEGVWSAFIVGELVRIRVEHSIKRDVERRVYRHRINDLLHLLSDVLVIVNYREAVSRGALPDADDEPVLATALVAKAGHIVSLNTRDFPEEGMAMGVRFLTPDAFLVELESRYPDARLGPLAGQSERQLP